MEPREAQEEEDPPSPEFLHRILSRWPAPQRSASEDRQADSLTHGASPEEPSPVEPSFLGEVIRSVEEAMQASKETNAQDTVTGERGGSESGERTRRRSSWWPFGADDDEQEAAEATSPRHGSPSAERNSADLESVHEEKGKEHNSAATSPPPLFSTLFGSSDGGGGGGESGRSSSPAHASDGLPSRDDLDELSIKELKALIRRGGMSTTRCVERHDLKERAQEAVVRIHEGRSRAEFQARQLRGTNKHSAIIAGLETIVLEPTDQRDVRVTVFCFHGYQASAKELAVLMGALQKHLAQRGTRFVLPQAPESQWWPIHFASYIFAMMRGEDTKAKKLREVPEGVAECRVLMETFFDAYRQQFQPSDKETFCLMGFSQGAMLALDTALVHLDLPVSGVILIGGFLMDVEFWAKQLRQRRDLRVLQIHGLNDNTVPFAAAQWLNELLVKSGARVQFIPHSGGHDIGPAASTIQMMVRFLLAIS